MIKTVSAGDESINAGATSKVHRGSSIFFRFLSHFHQFNVRPSRHGLYMISSIILADEVGTVIGWASFSLQLAAMTSRLGVESLSHCWDNGLKTHM